MKVKPPEKEERESQAKEQQVQEPSAQKGVWGSGNREASGTGVW